MTRQKLHTLQPPLHVLMIDPSLYTAPYDAALMGGLASSGVKSSWALRPFRAGEQVRTASGDVLPIFYKHTDRLALLSQRWQQRVKGISHLVGLVRLIREVQRLQPDVVHFQWLVLPLADIVAMYVIGRSRPVILTVHDSVPYNGDSLSLLQRLGFDGPLRLADRLIVHTRSAQAALMERGVDAAQIEVIPHGPLELPGLNIPTPAARGENRRWTFVMFGEIKCYKGVDVFIDAIGQLPEHVRKRCRFIIAGRPRMAMNAIEERIAELALEDAIEIRAERLSEPEMAELFTAADCFVFPYRQIDASGVYFLVKGLARWIIASRVGIFAEELPTTPGGTLVPPGDADALAKEMLAVALKRPQRSTAAHGEASSWSTIGRSTRNLYSAALAERRALLEGDVLASRPSVLSPIARRHRRRCDLRLRARAALSHNS